MDEKSSDTDIQPLDEQIKVFQALQNQVNQDEKPVENIKPLYEIQRPYRIAFGTIYLPVISKDLADDYPDGYTDIKSLDPNLQNSELFITVIGKASLPVASKKINNIQKLSFPLAFEITSEDLLFPYNLDAWLKSPLSKDDFGITCVVDSDGLLATPNSIDRFGFTISQKTLNPNQRPAVRIDINLKVDPRDYTESDKELLSSIDKALTK